jgi:hypothetical protein
MKVESRKKDREKYDKNKQRNKYFYNKKTDREDNNTSLKHIIVVFTIVFIIHWDIRAIVSSCIRKRFALFSVGERNFFFFFFFFLVVVVCLLSGILLPFLSFFSSRNLRILCLPLLSLPWRRSQSRIQVRPHFGLVPEMKSSSPGFDLAIEHAFGDLIGWVGSLRMSGNLFPGFSEKTNCQNNENDERIILLWNCC